MNIDLRSLRHVVVLSRLLNYTKAAQELCITQSALSRSIQFIERDAKVKLFDRDRGGVHLTTVGRDFVERAVQLLRDADDLNQILRRSASAEIGEIAFGLGPLTAQALLPSVLPELFAIKPELRTHVMVRHVEALLPALMEEEIEFIITAESDVMKSTALKSEFIGWLPMSLIVRAAHPLLNNSQRQQQLHFPLLSPGHFSNIDKWPAYFRPLFDGANAHHRRVWRCIEDH